MGRSLGKSVFPSPMDIITIHPFRLDARVITRQVETTFSGSKPLYIFMLKMMEVDSNDVDAHSSNGCPNGSQNDKESILHRNGNKYGTALV